MTRVDRPVGCLAAAFWFASQFFLLYPVVVLFSLPFLELMGSPIAAKVPMTGWAHREILLFSGFGLVIGLLAGVFFRIGSHSTVFWAARRLWIIPAALWALDLVLGLLLRGRDSVLVGVRFYPANEGLDIFLGTLPTVLYVAYSIGVGVTWRWNRLRRFRLPGEA